MPTTTLPSGQVLTGQTPVPLPQGAPTNQATGGNAVIPTGSSVNATTPIDASVLSGGTTPFTLPPAPPDTSAQTAATLGSIPSIASITAQENVLTPAEEANQELTGKLENLSDQEANKTSAQTAAESAQNLPALNAQLTDLNSQITALKNQASAIPLQVQQDATGRGVTAAGLDPIQSAQVRQNTIKALGLSSLASALQGNIATAQSQADAAVKAQFDPIEQEIAYVQNAIAANKDQMTKEEQAQAETVQAQLQDRATQLGYQRQDMSTANAWAASAVTNNPGNQAAQLAAQQALGLDYTQPGALQKAMALLAQYQSDPNALAKQAADIALTRAQTNEANANTAKTQADASAENSATSLMPYLSQTSTGAPYVDLSSVSATERGKLAQVAAANGVQVITNTNEAADLTNITNAYSDLDTMQSTLSGLTSPNPISRLANNFGLNPIATALQTDPQKTAASTLQDAGLDLFKAISGVQGFRGNSSILQQIKENLPSIYDTTDTATQKLSIVRQLIQNRENAIVTPPSGSSSSTSGTTVMTGPDGNQYNVPNNQVQAFIAAGGHQ